MTNSLGSRPCVARWEEAVAPSPTVEEDPAPTPEAAIPSGSGAAEPVASREEEKIKKAKAEISLFVRFLQYDGDDPKVIVQKLKNLRGIIGDGMENERRIVLLCDQAVEHEASNAFTASHNPYTRIPKHDKGRLASGFSSSTLLPFFYFRFP